MSILPTLRTLTLLSGMQTEHCSGVSTSNRSFNHPKKCQTFQILSNSQSTLAALALQAWHSNSRIVSCMDWKRQNVICSPHVLMFSRSAGIQVLAVLPFAWRLRWHAIEICWNLWFTHARLEAVSSPSSQRKKYKSTEPIWEWCNKLLVRTAKTALVLIGWLMLNLVYLEHDGLWQPSKQTSCTRCPPCIPLPKTE